MKPDDADYRHIEQTYDEGSKDYSGHFKQPHPFIEPERQQFIQRLAIGSKILDCGCGPGLDAETFFRLGYKVTAIDLSDRFVDLTRKRVPGADVRKMDMRRLNFPAASFDGIWASFSLLHVSAADAVPTLSGFRFILRSRWPFVRRPTPGPENCMGKDDDFGYGARNLRAGMGTARH